MQPRERRQVGAHYTAEKNILKLVRSLFLDDLRAEFAAIKADGTYDQIYAKYFGQAPAKAADAPAPAASK